MCEVCKNGGKACGNVKEEEARTQAEEEDMWNRKANGAAINQEKKILYLLEFNGMTDQRADFEEKKTVQAERQSNIKMWWEH